MFAINFFPDTCVTQGITTTCGSSFEFLGQTGYFGTALFGAMIGSVLALAGYVFVLARWENKRIAPVRSVKNLDT